MCLPTLIARSARVWSRPAGRGQRHGLQLLYPIDSLHPAARNKAKAIWCAKDRLAAWQDAVLRKKFDAAARAVHQSGRRNC